MSTIYTDPPQSRNEAIIKSTIDGTQYTDPPQSRMEDLLLDLKETIEQSGGGTTVVANPEGEATDELEKIQVGSNIYGIPKDYSELDNKPQINGVTLSENKTASELGLQEELVGAQTVSGNPITISDAEAMNAESVVVELEPKQDLHGYDSPWVGGAGKNKLPLVLSDIKTLNTSGTWSGNVYSIANGTIEILVDNGGNVTGIKANGTFNASVNFYLNNSMSVDSGDIINGCPNGGSLSTYRLLCVSAGTGIGIDTGNGATINQSTNDCYAEIRMSSGITLSNAIFYPMIRKSTESADFAPYSNICPISGYSEVNVERVGKNLFDKTTATTQAYIRSSGTVYPNGNWRLSDYVRVEDEQYYTMSVVTMQSARYYAICFYDENKEYIGGYEQETEATHVTTQALFDKPSVYARFCVHVENLNNFMLEVGASKTTYEPYTGKTYTISLGGTKYGGELDVTNGVLTVKWASETFSSNDGWVSTSQSYPHVFQKTLSSKTLKENEDIAINWAKANISDVWYSNAGAIVSDLHTVSINTDNAESYVLYRIDGTTLSELDTVLTSQPLQVVYELATPLTIQLTPTQIQMLQNTNNISTDGTNLTLKYQPNNVIGECKSYTDEECSKVLPPLPTTDGTYHLSCEVTSGVGVLSWVSDS